jgi:MSHA biogenesis protein MshQ
LASDGSDAACGTNCLESRIGTTNIRYGRLAIANAHGSELAPLNVAISAEYFDGNNWTSNTIDSCSASSLAFDVHMKMSEPSHPNTISLSSGQSTLIFAAAGEDNTGYIDISAELAAKPWLQFDWNGDGIITNPTGRASFGLFKGNDKIIFRRELY